MPGHLLQHSSHLHTHTAADVKPDLLLAEVRHTRSVLCVRFASVATSLLQVWLACGVEPMCQLLMLQMDVLGSQTSVQRNLEAVVCTALKLSCVHRSRHKALDRYYCHSWRVCYIVICA